MEQIGGNSIYRYNIVNYRNSKTNGWKEYAPRYDDSVVEELDVIKFLRDIKCMLHSESFDKDTILRLQYSRAGWGKKKKEATHRFVDEDGRVVLNDNGTPKRKNGVFLSQCYLKAKIIRTVPQETHEEYPPYSNEGYQYFDSRWSGNWPDGHTRPHVSETIPPQYDHYSVIVLLCIKDQGIYGTDTGRKNKDHHGDGDGGTIVLTTEDDKHQDLELFLCSFGCLVDENGVAKLYSPDKVYDTFAYPNFHPNFASPGGYPREVIMRSVKKIELKMDNINNLLDFLYLVATIQQIPDFDFNSELHGLGITVPDSKMFAEFALDFLNSLKGDNIEQLLIKYKDKTIKKRKKYKIAEVLFRIYWGRMMDHHQLDWWKEYTLPPCHAKKLPKMTTSSDTELPSSWTPTPNSSSSSTSSDSFFSADGSPGWRRTELEPEPEPEPLDVARLKKKSKKKNKSIRKKSKRKSKRKSSKKKKSIRKKSKKKKSKR